MKNIIYITLFILMTSCTSMGDYKTSGNQKESVEEKSEENARKIQNIELPILSSGSKSQEINNVMEKEKINISVFEGGGAYIIKVDSVFLFLLAGRNLCGYGGFH